MSEGALAGVRVVSFGAFVAGNTAAKLMAEMGADVVKIEPRSRPEVLRTAAYAIGPVPIEPSGVSNTVMYATLSRGVRHVALDLNIHEARPAFHQLVAHADIVIENFAGQTLTRWGCAYEDLIEDNPRLVMLSLSGYGRTGPRAGYLGYASTLASYLGLSSAWEYTHGTLTDYITATTGAVAALSALDQARTTGESVYVDVAQIDAMAPILAGLYTGPLNTGQEEQTQPNRVPGSFLSGVCPCQGYDAWLAYEIEDSADWNALCALLGRDDLQIHASGEAIALRSDLTSALDQWASGLSAHTAMNQMQKAGLAAGVVQSTEDIWRDPQLHVRQFGEVVDQADLGPVTYPRSSQRWTKTPGALHVAPARLGEHTREVLRQWLGLTDSELINLTDAGGPR